MFAIFNVVFGWLAQLIVLVAFILSVAIPAHRRKFASALLLVAMIPATSTAVGYFTNLNLINEAVEIVAVDEVEIFRHAAMAELLAVPFFGILAMWSPLSMGMAIFALPPNGSLPKRLVRLAPAILVFVGLTALCLCSAQLILEALQVHGAKSLAESERELRQLIQETRATSTRVGVAAGLVLLGLGAVLSKRNRDLVQANTEVLR